MLYDTISVSINTHFIKFSFSALNQSHVRDLGSKPPSSFFGARFFCFANISKSQPSMIYGMFVFFRIPSLKNVLAQICSGPGPGPYRASLRPIYGPGLAHTAMIFMTLDYAKLPSIIRIYLNLTILGKLRYLELP